MSDKSYNVSGDPAILISRKRKRDIPVIPDSESDPEGPITKGNQPRAASPLVFDDGHDLPEPPTWKRGRQKQKFGKDDQKAWVKLVDIWNAAFSTEMRSKIL